MNSPCITGLSLVTPWGCDIPTQLGALRAGRSAVRTWDFGYSRVGAPLPADTYTAWENSSPLLAADAGIKRKLDRLLRGASFSTRIAVVAAIEAMQSAGYVPFGEPAEDFGIIVCGHQLQSCHLLENHERFLGHRDAIDPLFGLTGIDTYAGSVISELFALQGPCLLVGAACASGNMALLSALDLLRSGRVERMLVVAPPCEMHPLGVHSWVMLDAVVFRSFQDAPEAASRPFDPLREGFVPGQNAAALVLEAPARAGARGRATLLGAAANSNANRQTQPSEARAIALMKAACADASLPLDRLSAINAHATSTPIGDAVEQAAIAALWGRTVPVQATKSLLGHSLSASALTEAAIGVLQLENSFLHPSANATPPDDFPIDLVTGEARELPLHAILSNSFGFGGLNAAVVLGRETGV